ncbi:hypothetical protein SLS62_001210 [Diatrype stigma]|uniref:Uncharacterized protein n=1 Tax=Diatrype stigma TaxID=117547 RepID=A0AAN9YW26_9PEZI
MARTSFHGLFLRLPPAAAFLVLASVLGATDGHALPRQTKTVPLHELNVVAWPLLPTEAPVLPLELLRRQENTVCGYIGGNLDFPATCGAGSHCVLDTDNRIVGCCPNGGTCSTGVFTGCVDGNSSPQTEVNPYVYTCQGSDVCYQNAYAGGYSQYGCGSSDLATSVQTSVDGITASLDLPQSSVALTGTPSSLSEPTTIGSGTRSSAVTTTGSSASTTDSATTRSTSTDSASVTSTMSGSSSPTSSATSSSTSSGTPTNAPVTGGSSGRSRTGAIVGGTIGGVAGLVAVAGLVFLLRRRRSNPRQGPGPAPPAPPMAQYGSNNQPYDQQDAADDHARENYNTVPVVPPPQRYDPAHVAGVGTGLTPVDEEEDAHAHQAGPSARELDLSRAYRNAPTGLPSDDDTQPLTAPEDLANQGSSSYYEDPPHPGPIRGGNRPLWQQNRI